MGWSGGCFLWGSMFGKGKAYPELGGERGMGQGWYGAIGKLAIAALLIGAVLIWRAEAWLHVDVPLEHADVIVVLGGESGQRVIGAAELYHQGVAPKVFVTGSGDGGLIVRRLGMAGVPDAACESQSRSTYENAVLTKKALEASHPRSVMLVTSWFHSRRALAVFRDVWPEVTFGCTPSMRGRHSRHGSASMRWGIFFGIRQDALVYGALRRSLTPCRDGHVLREGLRVYTGGFFMGWHLLSWRREIFLAN